MLKYYIIAVFFFIPAFLTAQDFNYVHYDTRDGLAGSTVYSMCQDKDGFIWFGTENGLSRYDGTSFKNFTVKDGLPDNEVLKVFADSKGRVWIGTFSKEISFYYKGKIHNRYNDSLIKKINTNKNVESIVEDKLSFLAFSFRSFVVIVTPTDSVIKYNVSDIKKDYSWASVYDYGGEIRLDLVGNYIFFDFNNNNFRWENEYAHTREDPSLTSKIDSTLVFFKYDTVKNIIIEKLIPGKLLYENTKAIFAEYLNTTDGAWSVDTNNLKLNTHFLPGKKVSQALGDKENNLWFSTLGEGAYKLPSQKIKTIMIPGSAKENGKEIFSIDNYKNGILAGAEFSQAILLDKNYKIKNLDYKKNQAFIQYNSGANRLYSLKQISESTAVLGFDAFLVKLENNEATFKYISPIKSIEKIDNDFILVGTAQYAFKMRLKDMQITDTIWNERCTKVFYNNNHYYIGTLKGLYKIKEDKTYTYLGELHYALTRRITDIKNSVDNVLWISTSDNGIIAYKDGKIITTFTEANGLSSDICRTLFIDGDILWIGTDKGINKISIRNARHEIVKYSTSDGLPSNTINALYVKDSIVWVGSPAGLTYFNENSISNFSMCNLKMLNISVSGKDIVVDSVFKLSYKNNNINFGYSGISFRSGSEITYYYKLVGLNNEWKTTTANNIDYKSLPANDYRFELYAVNKYGVKSDTIVIKFSVAAPFWKTVWFYTLLFTSILGGTILIFNRRNKKTKQRLEEKNRFQKQFAQLEQQALQTQMNPHFIFNCLNSIQQYILTNEKEKANEYLTGFASLIRQTLDISAQQSITVTEEASYLKKYLDMERMRFGDSFEYSIAIGKTVAADYIHMPALLLQPYVENCLRHGIRYKKEGMGKVEISFSVANGNLHCIIKDNGVGRGKAAEYKSKQHIEYQSKGMNLTSKRIELLNSINENKITVSISDLVREDDGTSAGTMVEVNIPV